MVTVIFEAHGTTYGNENKRASGWDDVGLSELGKRQAKELGERYKNERFDAIFCSDLQRSYKTAEIAFAERGFTIIKDARLRECNYGDWAGRSSEEVEGEKVNRIDVPFPNGESYEQAAERIKGFLNYLLENYDGKKAMIVGHRATQYGLEHLIKSIPLREAVTAPWQWQAGWTYYLEKI